MQHTTNYNLNQWDAGDRITRADFNADNAAIDAALKSIANAAAGRAKIAVGSYTGTGMWGGGSSSKNSITFDFTPKFLLLFKDAVGGNRGDVLWALWGITHHVTYTVDNLTWYNYFSYNGNTVQWYGNLNAEYQYNLSGQTYYYLAIG